MVCVDHDPYTQTGTAWLWSGTDWTPLGMSGTPDDQFSLYPQALVNDTGRGRLRLFLGEGNGNRPPQFPIHDLALETLRADQPNPHVGQAVTFTFEQQSEAFLPWLFAVSENDWPGLPVDYVPYVGWRRLPIGSGVLLTAAGAVNPGILDVHGRGSVTLPIPNLPELVDFEFTAAAVTVVPAPLLLRTISNPVHVEIVR